MLHCRVDVISASTDMAGRIHSGTYKTKMAIYGTELMKPTIHEFLLQMDSCEGSYAGSPAVQYGPLSGIPRRVANVKFAPLEPGRSVKRLVLICLETHQSDPIPE